MRVSVFTVNPGDYKVFLDGVEQDRCTMADDEEGVIERYLLDGNGEHLIEDDCAQTEIVYGMVRIEETEGTEGNNNGA